ncbi:DUF6207 family protein [Streptomyces avermitilis]|uniref:DUF6207 family protein n=1 Tax=Streptomyces avermitilis TaxID=33903 RepID=UPI0036B09588
MMTGRAGHGQGDLITRVCDRSGPSAHWMYRPVQMGQPMSDPRAGDTPGRHACGNPGVADLEPRTGAAVGPGRPQGVVRWPRGRPCLGSQFPERGRPDTGDRIAKRTTRDVGQPGVRLRLYADLLQALPRPSTAGAEPSSMN